MTSTIIILKITTYVPTLAQGCIFYTSAGQMGGPPGKGAFAKAACLISLTYGTLQSNGDFSRPEFAPAAARGIRISYH